MYDILKVKSKYAEFLNDTLTVTYRMLKMQINKNWPRCRKNKVRQIKSCKYVKRWPRKEIYNR